MNDPNGLDAMVHLPNELDDLDNLFEFGDIDLNNIPDGDGFGSQMQQHHQTTHPNTPFQDISQPPPMQSTSTHDFGAHEQFAMAQNMGQQQQHSMPYSTEPMYQPTMQHIYNPQIQGYPMQSPHGYTPNQQIVPPTPNSYDMHGVAGRFMQQQQQQHMDPQHRAILEQRYGLRKDDAIAFTPMVSPAGTPQYHMLPEFTTPGAYFSPLTSPMLHAQNQQHQYQLHQQQQGYLTNPSTAPSSNTNSPIDPQMDIDMGNAVPLPSSTGPQPRKSTRRKIATARGTGAAGSKASQAAAQKAQKRKSSAQTPKQSSNEADNPSLRTVQSQPASAVRRMPSQFDSSGAESISPEPLSESVMGPPPRPGSQTQSPAISGQQQQQQARTSAVGPAATPKSLLTMRPTPQSLNGQSSTGSIVTPGIQDPGGLDDFALPEAASDRHSRLPPITHINTNPETDESTPRMSARKTPKLGPSSTPASSSAMQSPVLMSPMTASTPSAILRDKADGRGGKGSKKRSSGSVSGTASKMVSPALVPKISPSIKPLLPEGTPLNTATQAMLLASKSNYQNLLEGNRLPGVNYPDSLSNGLTTKRTSHKVAEQGRRNRINEALKEMQALIPKRSAQSPGSKGTPAAADAAMSPDVGDGEVDDGGNRDDGGAKSNASKAATVELANDYIKRMQKDYASQNARIERLESEKEDLMRRLKVGSGTEARDSSEAESV